MMRYTIDDDDAAAADQHSTQHFMFYFNVSQAVENGSKAKFHIYVVENNIIIVMTMRMVMSFGLHSVRWGNQQQFPILFTITPELDGKV